MPAAVYQQNYRSISAVGILVFWGNLTICAISSSIKVFREPAAIADDGLLDSLPVRDFRKDAKSQRIRANGLEQLGANGVGGLGGLDSTGRVDPLAPLDPHEWEVMRDSATPGQLQPAYDVLLTKLDSHPLVGFGALVNITFCPTVISPKNISQQFPLK